MRLVQTTTMETVYRTATMRARHPPSTQTLTKTDARRGRPLKPWKRLFSSLQRCTPPMFRLWRSTTTALNTPRFMPVFVKPKPASMIRRTVFSDSGTRPHRLNVCLPTCTVMSSNWTGRPTVQRSLCSPVTTSSQSTTPRTESAASCSWLLARTEPTSPSIRTAACSRS